MEDQNISTQDCGCSDGCCTPPKKSNSLWKRIIFIVIILAAGAIITVKLIGKDNTPSTECCPATQGVPCCHKTAEQDTTSIKSCAASEDLPCCSPSKSEK